MRVMLSVMVEFRYELSIATDIVALHPPLREVEAYELPVSRGPPMPVHVAFALHWEK